MRFFLLTDIFRLPLFGVIMAFPLLHNVPQLLVMRAVLTDGLFFRRYGKSDVASIAGFGQRWKTEQNRNKVLVLIKSWHPQTAIVYPLFDSCQQEIYLQSQCFWMCACYLKRPSGGISNINNIGLQDLPCKILVLYQWTVCMTKIVLEAAHRCILIHSERTSWKMNVWIHCLLSVRTNMLLCRLSFVSAPSENQDSLDPGTERTIRAANPAGVCWPASNSANVMQFVMRNTNNGQQWSMTSMCFHWRQLLSRKYKRTQLGLSQDWCFHILAKPTAVVHRRSLGTLSLCFSPECVCSGGWRHS